MSATELFTSRLGGLLARTRRFKVVTSQVPGKTDPLSDSQLPPIGSGHSKFPGLVAKSYAIAGRISVQSFYVDVVYGLPDALSPSFGGLWEVSASGSTDSHRQFYATLDDQQLADGVEPEIVGSYDYVEIDSPIAGEQVYETTTIKRDPNTGLLETKVIALRRLATRKKEGMDVTGRTGTLNLKRRFNRNINFGRALNRISMVNSDVFYGAAPGQLKFVNINMTPVLVSVTENPYGIGNDVILSFEWDAVGHQHRKIHTYTSPDGYESVVRKRLVEGGSKNPAVVETFSTYLEISFNALIAEI